jgi:hypothetical protein
MAFDDMLVFYAYDDDRAHLAAYDAATYTLHWTVPGGAQAYRCGPVVCTIIAEPAAQGTGMLAGLDPATGEAQWSMPCPESTFDLCLAYVQPLGQGDQLWLSHWAFDADAASESWILDATTGQERAGPTAWSLAGQLDDTTLLLRQDEYGNGQGLAAGENTAVGGEPERLWWARSRTDLSGLEILGTVDASWCYTEALPFLVCWTTVGEEQTQASVWQIRG